MENKWTWLFIKTALLILPILFVGTATLYMTLSIGSTADMDIGLILFIPLILIIPCWVFSGILWRIAEVLGFMYWAICFVLSLVVLILGLSGGYSIPLETSRSTDSFWTKLFAENPAFSWHCALLMLLIPRLDGDWTTYLNTEATYHENGNVSIRAWFSHEYTSGSAIKMGIIGVIALISAILYCVSPLLAFLPFILEGGLCFFVGKALLKEFLAENR